ncbi:hypothetical protein KNP414_03550 [Paenibacillus mucilaginosus KNP414]|uniref:Uncharacterized protein n=1 Tax=Paenibacillus mucilaginosus (strain KNP414) TaxID=1036673 RepID=F8FBC7_PAEMK|nr:hypothetical protein KNP414_03550 [Paenibacillus mucilaginosus KNP414]
MVAVQANAACPSSSLSIYKTGSRFNTARKILNYKSGGKLG